MTMRWITSNPGALGFIPNFLSENDPRSARDQFNSAYQHGGGWDPFLGFHFNAVNKTISYPGDPPLKPVGTTKLREETIFVYPHAWVLILQKDGSYEVARMD